MACALRIHVRTYIRTYLYTYVRIYTLCVCFPMKFILHSFSFFSPPFGLPSVYAFPPLSFFPSLLTSPLGLIPAVSTQVPASTFLLTEPRTVPSIFSVTYAPSLLVPFRVCFPDLPCCCYPLPVFMYRYVCRFSRWLAARWSSSLTSYGSC